MDTPISRRMRQLNGVAHIQDLLEAGFTRHQVAAMKNGGELIRPRIGWYVSPEISPEVVRAVRVGGMLGCCSAIASYGLPAPTDRRLHVALDPGASRLRSSKNPTAHPPAGSEKGVLLHWRDRHVPHERFRVGLVDALHQMSVCAPFEWTVAAIDAARLRSAGAPPLLDEVSLQRLRRVCSESGRRAADLSIDSSESVLETMVRLRLADSGADLRVQVPIGKYRADIVLDGWLVIECDGEHHSTVTRFASDRERDAYFTTRGVPGAPLLLQADRRSLVRRGASRDPRGAEVARQRRTPTIRRALVARSTTRESPAQSAGLLHRSGVSAVKALP